MLRHFLATLVVIWVATSATQAADIYLRPRATVQAAAVRLGDVAEVIGGDTGEAERLAATELFPLPTQDRYITARQVRDALLARRVDLNRHAMSGASIIEIVPEGGSPTRPGQSGDVFARRDFSVTSAPDRTNSIAAAIVRFLKARVDADLPWQVEMQADPQTSSAPFPPNINEIAVAQADVPPHRGAIRPWLGERQFVLRGAVESRRVETTVRAEVTLPSTIVVAARDLQRAAVLQDSDVRLRVRTEAERSSGGLSFPEEVAGQQTQRPFRAGQVIDADAIESPELVHRGERVSVVVNHRGVRVRTEGRARESGTRGDFVMIESSARRQAFQAKVSGVNEVEIDAGGVQTPSERVSGAPRQRF